MAKYNPEQDFDRFDGQDKPTNSKGIFVVPTGSASILNVSASIKGGTVGSTKDTFNLLDNLSVGGEYEEPWHESVHYLDKRVTELSNGLNAVADSNANQSGSVGSIGAANKVNIKALVTNSGSFSTRVTANDAKTGISTAQSNAITAGATIVNKTGGTLQFSLSDNNLSVISIVGRDRRTYLIPPQG